MEGSRKTDSKNIFEALFHHSTPPINPGPVNLQPDKNDGHLLLRPENEIPDYIIQEWQRYPNRSWSEALPQFCNEVNNRKSLEKLVGVSAALTHYDDGCLCSAYISSANVNNNRANKILTYTIVRGEKKSWTDFWPMFHLAIEEHDPITILGISTIQSPTSHVDCVGIIWWYK